jgi:hypothetical protein
MDPIDIAARLVGAFYAFGGVMALRAVAMDALLDRALSALSASSPRRKDAVRRRVLASGAVLTALSGLGLAMMSGWAPRLFLANLTVQAGWLLWARTAFPPTDEAEARGRRSVINAAVGWIVATALVLWLEWNGRLGDPGDPLALTVLGIAAATMVVWLFVRTPRF